MCKTDGFAVLRTIVNIVLFHKVMQLKWVKLSRNLISKQVIRSTRSEQHCSVQNKVFEVMVSSFLLFHYTMHLEMTLVICQFSVRLSLQRQASVYPFETKILVSSYWVHLTRYYCFQILFDFNRILCLRIALLQKRRCLGCSCNIDRRIWALTCQKCIKCALQIDKESISLSFVRGM